MVQKCLETYGPSGGEFDNLGWYKGGGSKGLFLCSIAL